MFQNQSTKRANELTQREVQHNNTLINQKETLPLDQALFFYNLTENFIANPHQS